ncbi:MAG: hypothetical protein ACYSU0_14935, partial [Planctomycetota bacterium]
MSAEDRARAAALSDYQRSEAEFPPAPRFDHYLTWRNYPGFGDKRNVIFVWDGESIGSGYEGADELVSRLRALPEGSTVLVYPKFLFRDTDPIGFYTCPLPPAAYIVKRERRLRLEFSYRDHSGRLHYKYYLGGDVRGVETEEIPPDSEKGRIVVERAKDYARQHGHSDLRVSDLPVPISHCPGVVWGVELMSSEDDNRQSGARRYTAVRVVLDGRMEGWDISAMQIEVSGGVHREVRGEWTRTAGMDGKPSSCRDQMLRIWKAIQAYVKARGEFPKSLHAVVAAGFMTYSESNGFLCVETGDKFYYSFPQVEPSGLL